MNGFRRCKKKKIRGWKRRIRQVNSWGEGIKEPYLEYFISNTNSSTYNRCYLYPFYTLDKRHPPLWFFKLILSKFIKSYSAWETVFNDLGLPYDLQLWVYDPAYIRSEITCFKMNEAGERKRFTWESTRQKPFPYDKFTSPLYNLEQFEWLLADDEDVIWEDDIEFNETTPEELMADGFIKKEIGGDEVYYARRAGDIWIGRYKGTLTSDDKNIMQSYFAPPKL